MDSLPKTDTEFCVKREPNETVTSNLHEENSYHSNILHSKECEFVETWSSEKFIQNKIKGAIETENQNDIRNEIQVCPDITAIYVKCVDDTKLARNDNILERSGKNCNKYEMCMNKPYKDVQPLVLSKIQCYHCGSLFATKLKLRKHVKIDNNKCKICNQYFGCDSEFRSHLKVHSWKNYVCIICNKEFTLNINEIPKNVDFFQCETCAEDKSKLFLCKYCPVKFVQREFHIAHLKTHQNRKSFRCDLCDHHFSNLQHIKRHIEAIHNGETNYQCEHCEKCFRWDSSLRTHLKTHTNDRPHRCFSCNYSFRRSCDLKRHMITHTNEKKFACKHCDKRFTRNSSLQRHVRAHFGEKPYLCSACGKRFNESFFLKEHMESHSENRLYYYCDQCDKRFSNRRVLRMHAKKHVNDDSKNLLPETDAISANQLLAPENYSFFGLRRIWE